MLVEAEIEAENAEAGELTAHSSVSSVQIVEGGRAVTCSPDVSDAPVVDSEGG